uniref:beta strand repeat-containing protein n=1 Tax=Chryseolinea sp. H1M3-3 TaxID=3034144 RepID=UPI0023EBECA8
MLRFYKTGLIFLLSFLGILLNNAAINAQCNFTNLGAAYCINEPSFALTGGTNYYGPGVTGSTFDPAGAGVGTHQLVTTDGNPTSYAVVTGVYNPESPVAPTSVILGDNSEQLVNIGFTFNFFGTDYTQLRIGSNGVLGLGGAPTVTSLDDNQALGDAVNPNNIIAVAWDDLTPDLGGAVSYFITGSAPFRKFVVDYIAVDRAGAFTITAQAQLHETTNIIEIHTLDALFATNTVTATQGIESHDLGSGITTFYGIASRNDAQWDAMNDFVSFVPTCLDIQTVTINALPSAALTVSPATPAVCSGSSVPVTINTAEAGVLYQLQDNATDAPLSGFFLGTGANLIINSDPVSANVTIKVYARHATTLCEVDLTDVVAVTVDQSPTLATAGPDQTLCSTSTTLAGNVPVIGAGLWTIVSGAGGSFLDATDEATTFSGVSGTTYVLQWTISNGVCASSSDQVTIRFDAAPSPAANAGADQTLCTTSATLAANTATTGTGIWTVVSGAGGSFVNANSPTTVFNGVAGTTYDLQWTISSGVCAPSSDNVQIQFDQSPTLATAGPDQTLCLTSATLAGNVPVIGTGLWTIVSGAGGSFLDATDEATTFSGVSGTTYVLQWTISNGVCASSSDQVTIRFDAAPSPAANAGTDQTLCTTSATLAANTATTGTGTWTVVSGAGGSFVNANSPTTVFNGVAGTTYDLQWTISSGVCAPSSDNVQIQFDQSPTIATAGPDQTLCSTSTTLAGNVPVIGTGLWTIVSGAGGSFLDATDEATTFSGVSGTTYVLQWTISNGVCASSSDQVTLRFDAAPSPAANAGTDQTLCLTSATLAGNAPVIGTGIWTVVSGAGGSFVNANSPTTVFNGVAGTTYDLQWTISSGVCAPSSDIVQIQFDQSPTIATAGPDQTLCSTSTTLAGNVPVIGTGLWTIVSGAGGSFLDATDEATTFSGVSGTTYVLQWTISNGVCASSLDQVTIHFDAAPSPAANAGADQTLCTTSVTLAGNAPVIGTGTWTVVSGAGGSFVNANSPTTVFNGIAGTTYDLQWTISSGVCAPSSDIVQIQFDQLPTIATAGADQTLCSTSTTLAGNVPVIGTGLWTIVSGAGGSFLDATDEATTFSGVSGTTYVLQWTISNGVCVSSSDQVTIRFDAAPSPAANAGTDQTLCTTSATLAANTATTGTGTWTVVSGAGGSFVNANSPTTVFNGVSGTTYDLQWTISSGVCAPSSDIVQIQFDQSPTVATAGPDQTLCLTSATLAGNVPVIGTGLWTIVSGAGGSFLDATDEATTFSGVSGTTYVLQWTISNGVCASSSDQVTIRFDAAPSPAANAGTDQTLCTTSAILAANTATTGTGTWTVVSGAGGSFVNANSPTTVFNGVAGTTYDLQWTISSGVCAPSSDIVQIQFDQSPTIAAAGPDQTLCSTSTTLAGNVPVIGTGLWTIVSGAGGSFLDATDEATTFSGVSGTTYVLQWTISNGVCASSSDQVTIRFDAAPSPAANAGTDQTLCTTSATLAANTATTGTGTWTVVSGAGGSFVNANSPTTVFNGVAGTTYDLQWTISNGVCAPSSDIVQIQFDQLPTIATAGADQTLCSTSTTLAGNVPVIGTGLWTIVSGAGGSFLDATDEATTFSGVSGTTYVLQWTISNGVCASSSDQVTIRFDAAPSPAANAGTDQTLCTTSATLAANTATTGTGTWTVVSGAGGSFVNANSPTTVFNGIAGTTYDLQWTISSGVCAPSSDIVQIQFDQLPTIATAGADQTLCSTSTTLAGNVPVIGTGLWTIVSGAGGSFLDATDEATTFSGVSGTTYVLQWTISNGVCASSSDQVTIRFDAAPSPAANAGADQTLCTTSATLAANTATTGTGTWTVVSGAGGSFVNANNPTTVFNGVAGTTYDLQWTISSGVCVPSSDIVQIQFDQSPTIATAGADQTLCSTSTTLAGNVPVIGTGLWTIVSGAGGSFLDATDEATTFSGVSGTTYVLQWTISNGVCASSSDQVTIRFDAAPSPAANAGTDQTLCTTSATLAANTATTGTGTWTVVS